MKIAYTHSWETFIYRDTGTILVEVTAYITDTVVSDPDEQLGEREVVFDVTDGTNAVPLSPAEHDDLVAELDERIRDGLCDPEA